MSGTVPILGFPDVRVVPVYIYGLAEPDTGLLRYVGKSHCPRERLSNHKNAGSASIRAWFANLALRGFEPVLVILRIVQPGEDADHWEQQYIREFSSAGLGLLNGHTLAIVRTIRPARPCATTKMSRGAELLRACLTERKWGQGDLRRHLACADGSVSRWLSGVRKPGRVIAIRLEKDLGVPLKSWDEPATTGAR